MIESTIESSKQFVYGFTECPIAGSEDQLARLQGDNERGGSEGRFPQENRNVQDAVRTDR